MRAVVLLGFGAGAAVLLGLMMGPFLPALVASGVLGLLGMPAHHRIHQRVRHGDVAALLSTVAVVVVILLPIFGVSMIALRDLTAAFSWFESQLMAGFPFVGDVAARVDAMLRAAGVNSPEVGTSLAERLRSVPDLVLGRTFSLVSGLGGLALQVGVAIFTLFYLFRDGDRLFEAAKRHFPLASGPTELLAARAKEVIFAAVFGHVLVALVQGAVGGLAFWALGLPTPVVWGALMSALSLIPLVGPAFVWLPTGVVLLATGAPVRGAALLAFGLLVISTIDNVIRAWLVGARARVHPLVVFLGVLGGVLTFGAIGIFVGPVLIVVAGALLEMARLALFPEGEGTRPADPAAPAAEAALPTDPPPAEADAPATGAA